MPVTISLADRFAEFDAKIDTGSTFCVFQRLHGELLDIEPESGLRVDIGTPAGSFTAFGHEVSLSVLGIEIVSTVYFAQSDLFDRNILGRIGWLDHVKMGLVEREGKLLLKDHQS